jgi:hypothetical protein
MDIEELCLLGYTPPCSLAKVKQRFGRTCHLRNHWQRTPKPTLMKFQGTIEGI